MISPLKTQYFRWLTWLLVTYLFIIVLCSGLYQLSAVHGEGGSIAHEVTEMLVLAGTGILALPIMLIVVRWMSSQMLTPLQAIRETAERIVAGKFGERIQTKNPDDDLGRLATALNSAFDRYRDAMDRQQRFASDASHQLRTPLTAIRTTGEVSLQKDRTPGEYREIIGSMLEDVQRLSDMVEKLLMLARLGEDQIRASFATVDLGVPVRDVLSQYESLASTKGLRIGIRTDPGCRVPGDAALLGQMFANLLDNALRHTPDGGQIQIELLPPDARHVTLLIRDTGPGIPGELREQLFQRFARGPSADTGGSGLGLAIVADIVNLHRGRIELLAGPGACFRITLPRAV